MGSNQTTGSYRCTAKESWRAFDALSPRARLLVAHVPYDIATPPLEDAFLAHGRDDAAFRAWFIGRVFALRDRELRKAYGSDHPMIGAR